MLDHNIFSGYEVGTAPNEFVWMHCVVCDREIARAESVYLSYFTRAAEQHTTSCATVNRTGAHRETT